MADDKGEVRDIDFLKVLPWTEIFRGFQVALDLKKLLLAAAGILVMSLGWSLISVIFYNSRHKPDPSDYVLSDYQKEGVTEEAARDKLKSDYENDLNKWQLLNKTAGPGGALNTWPWSENRGPNPYLLAIGKAGHLRPDGTPGHVPWEQGRFWDWLFGEQMPVMIEPLVKFLKPVTYLLEPNAGFWNHVYFFCILVWTLTTWALFGGAITRMAVVELARKEKISMTEAMRFALSRYLSFLSAPLFPMVFVLGILVLLAVYGIFHMIPVVGDIVVDGLFWWLVLAAGVVMAVILVGLLGWPMMYATISAEGSDSFDALSRSYSYVFQCPWHYAWNSLVAIAYGALLVFFVGFMGSLAVYLGKWGVSQTPLVDRANRDPSFLFVYAPTSYQWRDLLLRGSPASDPETGVIIPEKYNVFIHDFKWWNNVGAFMVAIWLHLAFLMVVGFGYSYFWCASTIIYLLMRRQVDDTEMDEVYLEEDETEASYTTSLPTTGTPPSSPAPAPGPAGSTPLTMVDSPTLRPSAPPAPSPISGLAVPPLTTPAPATTPEPAPVKADTGTGNGETAE